jgi:hypothetical protein
MRILFSVVLLGVLALSGCARKKVADSPNWQQPPGGARSGNSPLTVTPENALVGKVVRVNPGARFVVLTFPLGRMPSPDLRLNLYRRGLMVGEVKVTGPQRENNIVADLVAGEAAEGDDVRAH